MSPAFRQAEKPFLAWSLTAISAALTVVWPAYPLAFAFLPWGMWVWFVCCGVFLLSAARFRMRHAVPLPELWLLLFPFAFQFFFQVVCPTTRVATVDELLWTADRCFGHPQIFLSKLLLASSLLFWACKLTWWSLPTLFVLLYLALPEAARRKYLAAIACTGCLILPLYALCPAAGPIYLFGSEVYPNAAPPSLPHAHPTYLRAGLLLNTTPSGHVAWALLLFGFAVRHCRKWVTAGMGAAAAVTVIATLALGEHYVIDLVLSCPYAAAIWSLVERRWRRAAALLAMVTAWLIVLRGGLPVSWPLPVLWWTCGLTMLAAAIGVRKGRIPNNSTGREGYLLSTPYSASSSPAPFR